MPSSPERKATRRDFLSGVKQFGWGCVVGLIVRPTVEKQVSNFIGNLENLQETANLPKDIQKKAGEAKKWAELKAELARLKAENEELKACNRLNQAGFEAEKRALTVKQTAEKFLWQTVAKAEKQLITNTLASEKDQLLLALCNTSESMIEMLIDANKIIDKGIEGLGVMRRQLRKSFCVITETLDITDDLEYFLESGLLTFSKIVKWPDEATHKITQPLEGIIDRLCER